MSVDVAFPESLPLTVRSNLIIYNRGVRGGVTTLLIHAFFKNPVSAAVISFVKVRKIHRRRFGTEATISFPVIAGGSGSVTAFSATLNKRFSYKRKRESVLTLKCPDGKIRTRGEAIFNDGTHANAGILSTCIPKR